MGTTREEIKGWFEAGVDKGATHMLVVCDTFDWSDYPVFVKPGHDARKMAADHDGPNMQKLMEVYNLSMPIEPQLEERRARNF